MYLNYLFFYQSFIDSTKFFFYFSWPKTNHKTKLIPGHIQNEIILELQ